MPVRAFETAADPQVQADPLPDGNARVEDALVQRVDERIASWQLDMCEFV
jgi:hypothetical protein